MSYELKKLHLLTFGGRWAGCQRFRRKLVDFLRSGGGSVVIRGYATSAEGKEAARKLLLARLRPLNLVGSAQLEVRWAFRSSDEEVAKVRPICMLNAAWFGLTFEREKRPTLALQTVRSCLMLKHAVFGKWGICPWELPSKV